MRINISSIKGGCLEIDPVGIKDNDVDISHAIVDKLVMNSLRLSTILKVIRQWVEANYDVATNTTRMQGPIILSFDNKALKLRDCIP